MQPSSLRLPRSTVTTLQGQGQAQPKGSHRPVLEKGSRTSIYSPGPKLKLRGGLAHCQAECLVPTSMLSTQQYVCF